MRAIFYVFSGTGNTRRVCDALLERWRALGHDGELVMIRRGSEYPDPREFDCVIVGYPVHAFNAPSSVLKFLKKLPRSEKKIPVHLVRTSGEPLKLNDASGVAPRRILKRRGYTVCGEFHYVMPYNIIFRHSEAMASRMWQDAELMLDGDVRAIASGTGECKSVNAFKRLVAFTLRIEHPAMPIIGKTFRATKTCVGCGACEKLCPQRNIRMVNGKPKFGMHCVGCMACSFGCPKDALRISVLNGWRVNGRYSFTAAPATDGEVCKYCRKAYLKYFREAEALANKESTDESTVS